MIWSKSQPPDVTDRRGYRQARCRALPAVFHAAMIVLFLGHPLWAGEQPDLAAKRLLKAAYQLAEGTHYLEALDLFDEAAVLLRSAGLDGTALYADILYASAKAKIQGRIHQGFPAAYVKSALKDVQAANDLREKQSDVIPQKLAESYYLEGYIHKKFFLEKKKALECLTKSVKLDPGHSAAKRALSELIPEVSPKKSSRKKPPSHSKRKPW